MLSHGNLDLSFFFFITYQWPKSPRKIICHEFWRNRFVYLQTHLLMQATVSKNIELAVEYLQRDLDKLARWRAKWRIKLNTEKTKVIIFSKSRFAIRAEPALSLYGDFLSYYPHIKFLGITSDNTMTFTKHFEDILERCKQRFHGLKYWSTKSETQVTKPFYKSTNNV